MAEFDEHGVEEWKRRYLDALEQIEQKETEWGKVDQLLRQCISRLTLAADSSDKQLNSQLDELRAAIRAGRESAELGGLIASLSDSILRLDEERKKNRQLAPPEFAIELLNAIKFPRGMRHRANDLIRTLVKEEDALDSAQIVEQLSQVLTEALNWAAESGVEEEEVRGKGVLGRLFKREQPAASTEETVADGSGIESARRILRSLLAQRILPEAQLDALREKVGAGDTEPVLEKIAGEISQSLLEQASGAKTEPVMPVNEALIRLLERLDVPEEFSGQRETLKVLLEKKATPESVEKNLVEVADLVAAMRSKIQGERRELEVFLLQLTERLGELDKEVQGGLELHRDSVSDGLQLGETVNEQMQGLEDSVEQAEELSSVKSMIQQRVDVIRNKMEEFRDSEESRLAQAEGKVRLLTEKLIKMEGETRELRKRVERERNQAQIDTLTRVPNRLAYNERLSHEYARWKRYGSALTLCVWDIDFFKKVNDTYGHQAGDKVLSIIAKVLVKQVRETDFVARFGGEEFVMLLPETELDAAMKVVEKIRASIENCEFHFKNKPVPITASCGVSQFREGDGPEKVFQRADKALYRAKQEGRNRCIAG